MQHYPHSAVGNTGNAPEPFTTPNGTIGCNFNLATKAGFDRKLGKEKTTWVKVTCWGDLADLVCRTVHKGTWVICQGYLDPPSTYEKDGQILPSNHSLNARSVSRMQRNDSIVSLGNFLPPHLQKPSNHLVEEAVRLGAETITIYDSQGNIKPTDEKDIPF